MIGDLHEQERERFALRTHASRELFERASSALAGGVTSSFHGSDPWPVYIDRGEGARIWDVDGNEYLDFHNGFSAMVQGHAHPAIVAAVRERAALGTHFGATTEQAVAVAEELTRRFGLPFWRFTNSGTESNMAAIKLARAATGREPLIKMAGSYHGHAEIAAARGSLQRRRPRSSSRIEETQPAAVLMEGAMTSGGLAPARARLPRGRARAHAAPRGRADLRRGEDRADDRRRRRRRAARRRSGHRHARQVAHGRPAGRRGRHDAPTSSDLLARTATCG